MMGVPQPSHEKNSFKSCITWPNAPKQVLGLIVAQMAKNWHLGIFLQILVNTNKFSSRFYLSNLKNQRRIPFSIN